MTFTRKSAEAPGRAGPEPRPSTPYVPSRIVTTMAMPFSDQWKKEREYKRLTNQPDQRWAVTKKVGDGEKSRTITVHTFTSEPDEQMLEEILHDKYGGGDYNVYFTVPRRVLVKRITLAGEPRVPRTKGLSNHSEVMKRLSEQVDAAVAERLENDPDLINALVEERIAKMMPGFGGGGNDRISQLEQQIIEMQTGMPPNFEKWSTPIQSQFLTSTVMVPAIEKTLRGAIRELRGMRDDTNEDDLMGEVEQTGGGRRQRQAPRNFDETFEGEDNEPPRQQAPPQQQAAPPDAMRMNLTTVRELVAGMTQEQKNMAREILPRMVKAIKQKEDPYAWTQSLLNGKIFRNFVHKEEKRQLRDLAVQGWDAFEEEYGSLVEDNRKAILFVMTETTYPNVSPENAKLLVQMVNAWNIINTPEGKGWVHGCFCAVADHFKQPRPPAPEGIVVPQARKAVKKPKPPQTAPGATNPAPPAPAPHPAPESPATATAPAPPAAPEPAKTVPNTPAEPQGTATGK